MKLFKKNTRNVLLFSSGQFFSIIGDAAEAMALTWWILSATGSGAAVASITVPGLILRLVLTPLLGPIADRYSRKNMLLVANIARFIIFAGVAVIALSSGFHKLALTGLYIIANIFGAMFSASSGGYVPSLVDREDIPTAMQQYTLAQTIAGVSGGLIGGVIVSSVGVSGAMFINSFSFLLSVVFLMLISQPVSTNSATEKTLNFSIALNLWWKDLKDGFAFVIRFPPVAGTLLIFMGINFFTSWHIVAIPALIKTSALGIKYLGLIESVGMAGSIFSLLFVSKLSSKAVQRPKFALLSLLLTAICFFFFPWVTILYIPPIAMFVAFAAISIFNMLISGQLMVMIPDEYRSRVGSLISSICQAAAPIGISIAGILIDKTSPSSAIYITGAGMLALIPLFFLVPNFFAFLRCEADNAEKFLTANQL